MENNASRGAVNDGPRRPWALPFWRRARPSVVLQALGLDELAWQELQPLLARLARELKIDLSLALHEGDAVLIDPALRAATSPQLLQAFAGRRPVLEATREFTARSAGRAAIDVPMLREQLLGLVQRRRSDGVDTGPDSGVSRAFASAFTAGDTRDPDSGFDSRHPGALSPDQALTPAEAQFLAALHAGKADPLQPPLVAGYGAAAMLVLDFGAGVARLRPAALTELRLALRLPGVATDWKPAHDVVVRELDRVIWEVGYAAGCHALLGADEDWWYTPLVPLRLDVVARHSSLPLHREMARELARGGVTPSQLRRQCRAGVVETRRFLQACLFLALVSWQPSAGTRFHARARLA